MASIDKFLSMMASVKRLKMKLVIVFASVFYHIGFAQAGTNIPPHPSIIHCYAGKDCLLSTNSIIQDALEQTVEWQRVTPDRGLEDVHFYRQGRDSEVNQHADFRGRTSLDKDGMKKGIISLRLIKVKKSDAGRYTCDIYPRKRQIANIQVIVDWDNGTSTHQLRETDFVQVSRPEITIEGLSKAGGMVLQCESEGWPVVPEVFWLDGEGTILPADVMETERDHEDLYTVRSNVTVQRTGTNIFTCTLHLQNHIYNKTIRVPGELFPEMHSGSYGVGVVSGVGVGCFIAGCVVTALGFLLHKLCGRKESPTKEPAEPTGSGEKLLNGASSLEDRPANGVHELVPVNS